MKPQKQLILLVVFSILVWITGTLLLIESPQGTNSALAAIAPTPTPRRQSPAFQTFKYYFPMVSGPSDSFTLINQDLANGIIDLNQATLYKSYALFKNAQLPVRYQSGALIPQEGSVAYLETSANWEQLNATTRQTLIDFLTPVEITSTGAMPNTPGRRVVGCDLWWIRTSLHFWIYYPLSGTCVGQVTPLFIENLATGLENAWSRYTMLGYRVPSLTQVYVVPLQVLHTPGISKPDGLFISNDINTNSSGGAMYLQTIAAHEFFHTVQWSYFGTPPVCRWIGSVPPLAMPSPFPDAYLVNGDVRWWMETSAQWAQKEVVSSDRSYFQYTLGAYLNRPWQHLDTPPMFNDVFAYGTVLFPIYLTEHLPAQKAIIKTTWERYSQMNSGCGAMMPALQSALQTQGTTVEQVFPSFSETNYTLDYQDQLVLRTATGIGPDFRPNPWPHSINNQSPNIVGPNSGFGGRTVERLGSAYLEFRNDFSDTIGRALTITTDIYIDNTTVDPVVKFWAIQQYTPTVISKTIVPNFQLIETIGSTRHYVAKAGVPGFDSYKWVAMMLVNPKTSGTDVTYTYSAGVIPPAVIYAGGNSKGFVSTNGGASWITYTFPSTTSVQAITAVTNTLGLAGYAGTSDLRLWKTTNAGQTFTPTYNFTSKVPITTTTSAHKIALVEVDPNNANVVYVGVRWQDGTKWILRDNAGALFKSTDGGQTFGNDILLHNGSVWVDGAIYSLAIDPRNSNVLYIGQYGYNNIAQEVMKSVNGGTSWTALSSSSVWTNNGGSARVKISPLDSASIFAITGENQGHGVYHSTNSGTTWTRIAQPLGGQWGGFFGLAPSLSNKDNATTSGTQDWFSSIARTKDGFKTWQIINNVFGPNDLEGHPLIDNVLYAPYSNGVRWTFDGGYTWFDIPLDLISDLSVTRFGGSVAAPQPKSNPPTPIPRAYP